MSEPFKISAPEIAAAGVRVGDLLRVKLKPGCDLSYAASPNAIESIDLRVIEEDWYEAIANRYEGALELLERVVDMPTAPYSVIAPPMRNRSKAVPLILDYAPDGSLGWTQEGDPISDSAVAQMLQEGWLPAGALAALTEGTN